MSEQTKKRWQGLGGGIYQDTSSKKFYHRPTIGGKSTFRLLDVSTLTQARAMKASLDTRQAMAEEGLHKDPYGAAPAKVSELITGYLSAGCPMRNNQAREGRQLEMEQGRLSRVLPFWGNLLADKIKPKDCLAYANLRKGQMREWHAGGRAIDMELVSLSAVFHWAVFAGKLDANPLVSKPKFNDTKRVRHCRDCMPRNADDLHNLARTLFAASPRTEALGWQLLLEAMTGCRTNEILRLRWDAPEFGAGHIDKSHLWLNRSKGGINPFVEIHPALGQTLEALRVWRVWRAKLDCPFFIPGMLPGESVSRGSLTYALRRITQKVCGAGQHRTSHGLRAYYVTVRRSLGITDMQIAAEIGDKSGASIIASTYGAVPPNWSGGQQMGWMVDKPAWEVLALPQNMLHIASV